MLTRRPLDRCPDFPHPEALTNSLDALIEASDVVFECTGDAFYAARTIGRVLDAGKPVVTLNAEFHATIGSHFVERGLLSEAEGDQPGCLAALAEDAVATGFTPLVYCNMKAFLNRNPSPEEMRYWAERQDYSIEMVTSFTDGTKVQIEQCLVANGLGAGIAKEDLIGLATGDLKVAAAELGAAADRQGHPISEYILDRGLQHGVFIIARHDQRQSLALRNFKLGEGPYYVLIKDYCLVHLEVFKTIERLLQGRLALAQQRRRAAGQRRQHRQARARAGDRDRARLRQLRSARHLRQHRRSAGPRADLPGERPARQAPGRAGADPDHGRRRAAGDRGARGLAGDRAPRARRGRPARRHPDRLPPVPRAGRAARWRSRRPPSPR